MAEYLLDLHIHTSESSLCGRVSAREMVRAYREAGFHGVAITDHYAFFFVERFKDMPWADVVDLYMRGYEEAKAEAAGTDFRVYFGLEYRDRVTVDDYLIYGVDRQFLLDNPDLHDVTVREAAERVHKYGGVILQAHPGRMTYGMAMGSELFTGFGQKNMNAHMRSGDVIPEISWYDRNSLIGGPAQLTKLQMCTLREGDVLDGIEIYNGNHSWAQDQTMVERYRREHPEYVCIAASDFHGHPCGYGGTYFDCLPEDDKALVRALKERRITGWKSSYGVEL